MKQKHYFLHIPKTAGSTLLGVFRNNNEANFLAINGADPIRNYMEILQSDEWDKKSFIWLHGDWGMCNDSKSIQTMLRDPISRMESFYFYVKSMPNHYLFNLANTVDAVSFFERAKTLEVHNGQSRILSGYGGFHGMYSSQKSDISDSELLQIARHNLFKQARIFGLQERFIDSLLMFEIKLKWVKGIGHETRNTRAGKFMKESLGKKEIDCIKEFNKIDMQLFEEAREIFDERFRKMSYYFGIRRKFYRLFKR